MIAPVVDQGNSETQTTEYKVYFPGDVNLKWFSKESGKVIYGGSVETLIVPFDDISPYFIRAGSVIPY